MTEHAFKKDIKNEILVENAISMIDSTWIDVRCPREFIKGHYTDAINIPIFSNSEYEELGIIYKQFGQVKAIEIGKEFLQKSKQNIINKISQIKTKNIIIYCARGGMRSIGFEEIIKNSHHYTYRIESGYKSIRKYVLNSFDIYRDVVVIAGGTGTGKTNILHAMEKKKYNTIDLEKLAKHRGSVFGNLGIENQATQQQFENDLSSSWVRLADKLPVFIESESRKIGKVIIPEQIWNQMTIGKYVRIDIDIEKRVQNLINDYGEYPKKEIKDRIHKISKKFGGNNAKKATNFLDNNNLQALCTILLERYYDSMYKNAYDSRESPKFIIDADKLSTKQIIYQILDIL